MCVAVDLREVSGLLHNCNGRAAVRRETEPDPSQSSTCVLKHQQRYLPLSESSVP